MKGRIINMLPNLAFGDAVGNDARAIYNCLKDVGYDTILSAEVSDNRIREKVVSPYEIEGLDKDDVIIYHLSSGRPLNDEFVRMPCRKIIRYHNITPPGFFYGFSRSAQASSRLGYKQLERAGRVADYILAVSDYNLSELRKRGWKAPGSIMPIMIPFEDYEKEYDRTIYDKYNDGKTNILFTGRIAPNKRHEQLIKVMYHYVKDYDENARLIMVGNPAGMEKYSDSLRDYAAGLGIADNVIFTGHASFKEILAYYRAANVFLSMSDHEGFCVPLAEAMFFKIPVIAKDTSAIAETLKGAGILLEDEDPNVAAAAINRVMKDEDLRKFLISEGEKRIEDFSYEKTKKQLLDLTEEFINGKA